MPARGATDLRVVGLVAVLLSMLAGALVLYSRARSDTASQLALLCDAAQRTVDASEPRCWRERLFALIECPRALSARVHVPGCVAAPVLVSSLSATPIPATPDVYQNLIDALATGEHARWSCPALQRLLDRDRSLDTETDCDAATDAAPE